MIFGFILVLSGTIMSIFARRELGTNWTHATDYQIKKDHILVTTGIYAYVRHPIYFATNVTLIGAELVAESYVFLFYCLLFIYDYVMAKREKVLFLHHFSKKYRDYIQRTKMLIPFIF